MTVLPRHVVLWESSRLRLAGQPQIATSAEWVVLLLSGFLAATASVVIDLNWRMPGHAIVRAVLPMSLGFALAPRRLAGCVMGASAMVTAIGLQATGRFDFGWGATTSLVLTGPLLDAGVYFIKSPWQVPLAFGLAGLSSNLLAFGFRAAGKMTGASPGGQPLSAWVGRALPSYIVFGLAAGLISALIWFRIRPRQAPADGAFEAPLGGLQESGLNQGAM